MPTLGDILALARRDAAGFATKVQRADPALSRQLDEAARAESMTPTAFARLAIADYSRAATPDDWTELMTRLRNEADPAMTCLAAMIRWQIGSEGTRAPHELHVHDGGS